MRRFLTSFVVAACAAIVPTLALAGNQEVAEQIAKNLRDSGQLSDYRIGVKFQDGTVWLRGQVTSEEQMNTALRLAFQLPGVENVVNEIKVASADDAAKAKAKTDGEETSKSLASSNPLRGGKDASTAKRPCQNLKKKLGSLVSRKSEAAPSQPLADHEESASKAERVPSSYSTGSIRQTAAQEPQEIPESAAPQNAKPFSKMPHGIAKSALMQQDPRGPSTHNGAPLPMYQAGANPSGPAPARYDQPCLPNYAWPSYAAYPNYAAVTYPKQYSPTAWPYIGPFYPYPQVPLGWRKVTLEWDSGWWFLDFKDQPASCWQR